MDYRLLVLDLDGTTLNHDGRLEPRDVAAARALQAAGVHVTIATGRLFLGSQWVGEALGVTGHIAVMNGSELCDVGTGQATFGRYIEVAHRAVMRDVLAEHDVSSALLFRSRGIDVDRRDEALLPYLRTWTPDAELHETLRDSPRWVEHDDVLSMGAVGEAEAIAAVRQKLHQHVPEGLFSVTFGTRDGRTVLSVRQSGEDKGTALDRLAAERGCDASQTVAVGDWHNDVPMLRRAGLGLAMAGADPIVQSAADDVLQTPRGGGGGIAEVAMRVWGVSA
ncbi:MAG: Cof-type HAD-IIB family hydrolase [Myxococcales bacterium]|nr:Cof-type HAD-IIB family hydrolase [Myxococcales bacterium]